MALSSTLQGTSRRNSSRFCSNLQVGGVYREARVGNRQRISELASARVTKRLSPYNGGWRIMLTNNLFPERRRRVVWKMSFGDVSYRLAKPSRAACGGFKQYSTDRLRLWLWRSRPIVRSKRPAAYGRPRKLLGCSFNEQCVI